MVSRYLGPLRAMTAAVVVSLALAGCGSAPEAGSSTTDDGLPESIPLAEGFDPNAEFTFALSTFTTTWDPIATTVSYYVESLKPVYDRLLDQKPDGEVVPMLATEFSPSEDGSSLTLTLQEGLVFTDGTPFNAEAVKFNLDRARGATSKIANELHMVTGVEVIDDHTVTITVNGWLGQLLTALSALPGIMVSPTAAAGGNLETQPVGIGPYVLEEFVPGDRAVMGRSDNYWDPEAQRVATFTWRLIADDQTRLNALTSGDVDGIIARPDQLPAIQNNDLQLISKPSSWFTYLALDTGTAPFDDVEVRKALNLAIDREGIAQGLYDGYCTPQVLPFVEGSLAYSDKVGDGLDKYSYDPDAAKAIVGNANGAESPFEIGALNPTIYTKLGEILQANLKSIGLSTTVSPAPATELIQKFAIDRSSQMITTLNASSSDPSAILRRMVAPNALLNPGQLPNAEIMQYAAEGAATLDPATSKKAYDNLAEAWIENPPNLIPICNAHQMGGFSDKVSGVAQTSMGGTDLRGVAVSN